jgi:hypothetical protein
MEMNAKKRTANIEGIRNFKNLKGLQDLANFNEECRNLQSGDLRRLFRTLNYKLPVVQKVKSRFRNGVLEVKWPLTRASAKKS